MTLQALVSLITYPDAPVAGVGRPIGQTLQDEALAENAGLLVLGGATKGVLDDLRDMFNPYPCMQVNTQ